MAIDVNETFNELKNEGDTCVQDSQSWRQQIANDNRKDDPELNHLLKQMEQEEGEISVLMHQPTLLNAESLKLLFKQLENHLSVIHSLHLNLSAYSEYGEAHEKEKTARKSLIDLGIKMNLLSNSVLNQKGSDNIPRPLKERGQLNGSSKTSAVVLRSGVTNHTSNFFLDTMLCLFDQQNQHPPVTYGITQQFIDITQLFFDNEDFSLSTVYDTPLSDSDIVGLTSSWNAVIAVFADPTNAPGPCVPVEHPDNPVEVESALFIVHRLLDTLYDHLETDIKRVSSSILLPNIS